MIVLIPAYEPDIKLVKLTEDILAATPYKIVVVDDGSSDACKPIFEKIKGACTVLHHPCNKGKGAAIKTALIYIREHFDPSEGIVTADADGQHLPTDIIRVSEFWKEHPDDLILGSRRFTGKVPFKSKAGNAITRCVFKLCTGTPVYDTQTGLRAFSWGHIPEMLSFAGDRYEYEINMLLYAGKNGISIHELPIETVYIEDNKSSHFRPFRDGWRIYKMILLYVLSSLSSFLVDYFGFLLLAAITKPRLTCWLLVSEIGARFVSSLVNYYINKSVVFDNKKSASILKYFVVAAFILLCDFLLMKLFTGFMSEALGKILAALILYPAGFILQRKYVFPTEQH